MANKWHGFSTPEPDQDFEYTHDDIGNRITTGGHESFSARYAANALNQYTRRDDLQTAGKTTGFQYDADGNLVGDDQWICNCSGAIRWLR
jgi:YD repeat-containing protein